MHGVFDRAGSEPALRRRPTRCCLPDPTKPVGTHKVGPFRGSIPSLYVPLSTLRRSLAGSRRMTRGQCGSLLLHCTTLSFATPRRFNRRFRWGARSNVCAGLASYTTGRGSGRLIGLHNQRVTGYRSIAIEGVRALRSCARDLGPVTYPVKVTSLRSVNLMRFQQQRVPSQLLGPASYRIQERRTFYARSSFSHCSGWCTRAAPQDTRTLQCYLDDIRSSRSIV